MIRIGIVGAGRICAAHEKAIQEHPETQLVAVTDLDMEKARQVAAPHGAAVYTDYKQMAAQTPMDAVILNLPHFLHCQAAVFFLEAGIHVLVEKPMALSVEECDTMIEAAKRTGKKLAVGHVQHYYSALREVRKMVEDGRFGKLCMVHETRNLDYVTGRPKWFLTKRLAGGGIVMNFGAHSIDRLLYTTGGEVENIHAMLTNPVTEDDADVNAHIFVAMTGGVSASITMCGCFVPWEYEISYYFTHGAVKVRDGWDLQIFENGEYVSYGGCDNLLDIQMGEFVKFLKGEPSEMATAEYGKKVISILSNIL